MKQIIFLLALLSCTVFLATAQNKKDGTPDMRYSANRQAYGTSYSVPQVNYSSSSGSRYQSGYVKDNGTYVEPHFKTNTNSTNWDNYSTTNNLNPYTGNPGSRARDYSSEARSYGGGQPVYSGPRGGQYYINSRGNKVYVPKRY